MRHVEQHNAKGTGKSALAGDKAPGILLLPWIFVTFIFDLFDAVYNGGMTEILYNNE
jgi:hypothetical protein